MILVVSNSSITESISSIKMASFSNYFNGTSLEGDKNVDHTFIDTTSPMNMTHTQIKHIKDNIMNESSKVTKILDNLEPKVHLKSKGKKESLQILPSISNDESELVLGSIIERVSMSTDLYVSTFLLSRSVIDPEEDRNSKIDRVNIDFKANISKVIEKLTTINYQQNGVRRKVFSYACRVSYPSHGIEYTIPGDFMPNRVSVDPNANKKLDILRCKLQNSPQFIETLMASFTNTNAKSMNLPSFKILSEKDELEVEILRDNHVVSRFAIPWKTRRVGYLLSTHQSRYNYWQHYGKIISPTAQKSTDDITVHICASRDPYTDAWSPRSYIQLIEWIQHHSNIGIKHLYLSTELAWGTSQMNALIKNLSPYIQDGLVSVVSQASDGVNFYSFVSGLELNHILVKNTLVNKCLYLAKGSADFILPIEFNHFFIPKYPLNNIYQVLLTLTNNFKVPTFHDDFLSGVKGSKWQGGPGWADGDTHPYCALGFHSAELIPNGDVGELVYDRFQANPSFNPQATPNKFIAPTHRIYQGSITLPGACRLDTEWTGCKESELDRMGFCFADSRSNTARPQGMTLFLPPPYQPIDDFVFPIDNKIADPSSVAVIYKVIKRQQVDRLSQIGNDYSQRYGPLVKEVLKERNMTSDVTAPHNPTALSPFQFSSFAIEFPKTPPLEASEYIDIFSPIVPTPPTYLDIDKENKTNPNTNTPLFSKDSSELLLGAMIERTHESWGLYLTSFLLNNEMLWRPPPGYGSDKINPRAYEQWNTTSRLFNKSSYILMTGARDTGSKPFTCKIKHTADETAYRVVAEVLPNALTPDGNANKRIDIIRCKMESIMHIYKDLIHSDNFLLAQISRGNVVLFDIKIPWKTRRIGLGQFSPSFASSFDAWKGYHPIPNDPNDKTVDNLYMCVPGVQSAISQRSLLMNLEFMQHHYLMGVEHMFFTVTFSWYHLNMARYLAAMQSYIDEGLLTVSSHSGDNIDLVYSMHNLQFDRDVFKIFQVNMCMYLSRGVADYIAIWDIDEYFIPKPPLNSIMDLVRSVDLPVEQMRRLMPKDDAELYRQLQTWKGGRGFADDDMHPFCYIMLMSDVLFQDSSDKKTNDPLRPWIGMKFNHAPDKERKHLGFKKAIIPTRRIYQVGLHMSGACKMPEPWSICTPTEHSPFCNFRTYEEHMGWLTLNGTLFERSPYHVFDGSVMDGDAKRIDTVTQAVIYHVQMHRPHMEVDPFSLSETNDYTSKYFPEVFSKLKERGFHVLVTIPMLTFLPAEFGDKSFIPVQNIGHSKYSRSQHYPSSEIVSDDFPDEPSDHDVSTLPAFIDDQTEIVLDSIIELISSNEFYLTTFFLNHNVILNNHYNAKINNRYAENWRNFLNASHVYTDGKRSILVNSGLMCRIYSDKYRSVYYDVPATFVVEQDISVSNVAVDVLRCKMQAIETAILERKINLQQYLTVELYKNDKRMIAFKVSWKKRASGMIMNLPKNSSQYNSWRNKYRSNEFASSSSTSISTFELCVYGLDHQGVAQNTLALYAEFIQHHLSLKVNHIHLMVPYYWSNLNMERLLVGLKTFIDDKKLSIYSSTTVDMNFLNTFLGISLSSKVMTNIFENMCLYLTKGNSKFLIPMHLDDYLIPQRPLHLITDVTEEFLNKPLLNCIEQFPVHRHMQSNFRFSRDKPWVGDKFINGPEGNESVSRLPVWNINAKRVVVLDDLRACVPINSTLLQVLKFSSIVNTEMVSKLENTRNDYVKYYHRNVVLELRRRRIELYVSIPHLIPQPPLEVEKWIKFRTVHPGKIPFHERNELLQQALKNM